MRTALSGPGSALAEAGADAVGVSEAVAGVPVAASVGDADGSTTGSDAGVATGAGSGVSSGGS
jgi:hypothetical protein